MVIRGNLFEQQPVAPALGAAACRTAEPVGENTMWLHLAADQRVRLTPSKMSQSA